MTVFTPDALNRSKDYRCSNINELNNPDALHDRAFVFIYPSPDLINEINGDGDLIEIEEVGKDNLYLENGSVMPITDDVKIYVKDKVLT